MKMYNGIPGIVLCFGLICLSSLFATDIPQIKDDALLSSSYHPSQTPKPFISPILSDRYPGGIDNIIEGINQDRGEGLPYSTIRLIDLLTENHTKRGEKGKEKALTEEEEQENYIAPPIEELPLEDHKKIIRNWFRFLDSFALHFKKTEFLRGLDTVPAGEWKTWISTLLPLLLPIEHKEQRTWSIQIINTFPTTKGYNEVLSKFKPILENTTKESEQELEAIIESLVSVAPQERQKLLERAEPFITHNISLSKSIAMIISAISQSSTEEWNDLLKRATPFIKSITNGWERTRIVMTINKIPMDQRDEILSRAKSFTRDSTNGWDIEITIRTISRVLENICGSGQPITQEWNALLEATDPFIKDITDGCQKVNILNAISQTPRQEWKTLFSRIEPYMKDITDGRERARIIKAINKIPIDQRAEYFIHFIKNTTNILEKEKIIDTIVELLANMHRSGLSITQEWDVLLKAADPFIKDITNGWHKAKVVEAINKIPIDHRDQVLSRAALFTKNTTNGCDRARIIDSIVELLANMHRSGLSIIQEWGVLLKAADPFIKDITDGWDRARIVEAINKIPMDQRDEILFRAEPFTKSTTNGLERVAIINDISRVSIDISSSGQSPTENWENFLDRIAPFIKDITDNEEKRTIIKIIGKIPSQEWKELLEIADPCIKDITNSWEKIIVIYTISGIPTSEREQVVAMATPFIEGLVDSWEKIMIIYTITSIPTSEREQVVELAKPFMTYIKDGKEREKLIDAIENISIDKRAGVINKAKDYVNDITNSWEVPIIIKALSKVPNDLPHRDFKDILKISKKMNIFFTPESINAGSIFSSIQRIPAAERVKVLKPLLPYIIDKDGYEIVFILNIIHATPFQKCHYILDKGLSFCGKIPTIPLGKAFMLKVFQESPPEDWDSLFDKAQYCLRDPKKIKVYDSSIINFDRLL